MFKRWLQDESGATAIEYAMIAAIVAITALLALSVVADNTVALWTTINNAIDKNVSKP